jgi:hypothetical protein
MSENSTSSAPELDSGARLHSRRGLLTGVAAAGVGAATMVALGPESASATTPAAPVELGAANTSTATTSVTLTGSGDALKGIASAHSAAGLVGQHSGGSGSKPTEGHGVVGSTVKGIGVVGSSKDGTGIQGHTTTAGQSGISGIDLGKVGGHGAFGYSNNGIGVYGTSTAGVGVYGNTTSATGVYGQTAGDGRSGTAGIDNSSGGGHGSYGRSLNGTGAYGESHADGQCGVLGVDLSTGGGIGVKGQSSKGFALSVDGRSQFSTAGLVSVPEDNSSVEVHLTGVTTSSAVIATLQITNPDQAGIMVESVITANGSFTVQLTADSFGAMSVAYFVIG